MKKLLTLIVVAFLALIISTPVKAETPTGQTKYYQGITLQVWTTFFGDYGNLESITYEKGAVGGILDRNKLFTSNSMRNSPALKQYSDQHHIAIGWIGLLKVTKAGEHVFSFTANNSSYEQNYVFFLNDKRYSWRKHDGSFSASLELEPGLYKYVLFTSAANKLEVHNNIIATIKEPGMVAARELTYKDFYVPEAWYLQMRRR